MNRTDIETMLDAFKNVPKSNEEVILDALFVDMIEGYKDEVGGNIENTSFKVDYEIIGEIEHAVGVVWEDRLREDYPELGTLAYSKMKKYCMWYQRAENALDSLMESLYGSAFSTDKAKTVMHSYWYSLISKDAGGDAWAYAYDERHHEWYIPDTGSAVKWAHIAECFVNNKFDGDYVSYLNEIVEDIPAYREEEARIRLENAVDDYLDELEEDE